MIEFPNTVRKPRKHYKKSAALKELERLANEDARKRHPSIDPKFLAPRTHKDNSANSLTASIVKYIELQGGWASRINSTGVWDKRLGKYRTSTMKKGVADVMAVYKGLSLHIEIKIGKDQQSEYQKKVEADVNRAGGLYFVAKTFADFYTWFNQLKGHE